MIPMIVIRGACDENRTVFRGYHALHDRSVYSVNRAMSYITPERVIASLGTHAASLEPGSYGKQPGITMQSYCAALTAGIDPLYIGSALLKYLGDWTEALSIQAELKIIANEMAVRDRWRSKDGVNRLVMLALLETAHPATFKTQGFKALVYGCSGKSWSKLWRRRYEPIYRQIDQWGMAAMEEIKHKQRIDESGKNG